jgi:hypothetical protein
MRRPVSRDGEIQSPDEAVAAAEARMRLQPVASAGSAAIGAPQASLSTWLRISAGHAAACCSKRA